MAYQVVIPKQVQKDISRIDKKYRIRITSALIVLGNNPYLGKKLEGEHKDERSYTIWPYRIIYQIKERELIVLVVRVGHRQGVYKN